MSGLAFILIALVIVLIIFWMTRSKKDPPPVNNKLGAPVCIPVGDFLTSQFQALMPIHLGGLNENVGIIVRVDNLDITAIRFNPNLTTCDLASGKARADIQLVATNATFGLPRPITFTTFTLDAATEVQFIQKQNEYTLQSANVTDLNFTGTSSNPTAPGALGFINLFKQPLSELVTGVLNSALTGKTFSQPQAKLGFINPDFHNLTPGGRRPFQPPIRPTEPTLPTETSIQISQFLSSQINAVIASSSLYYVPITNVQTSTDQCLGARIGSYCGPPTALGRFQASFAVNSIRGLNNVTVTEVRLGTATWVCEPTQQIEVPFTLYARANSVRFGTTVRISVPGVTLANWQDAPTGPAVAGTLIVMGKIIGTYANGITTFRANNITLDSLNLSLETPRGPVPTFGGLNSISQPTRALLQAYAATVNAVSTFPSQLLIAAAPLAVRYVNASTVQNALQSAIRGLNMSIPLPGLIPNC